MKTILAIILTSVCAYTGSAIDADALYAQLNATPQGRAMLHGPIVTNTTRVAVDTNALTKVVTRLIVHKDGYTINNVTTNHFVPAQPRTYQMPPSTNRVPARYAEILRQREAAGWVAKPPAQRPPKVHVYSVMRCVLAAQQMGLWESAIKPFLITNNLIELVYTAQDFRSDNPNFKTAIQALTGMGIDQATIDAALKTAEIEGGK